METSKRYELNKELAQMLKGGVIMDVTTPVSYTHLIFQGVDADTMLVKIDRGIRHMHTIIAVSYTHLDVYKRQANFLYTGSTWW